MDRLKYVPLWRGAYVSFGGQHRLRYELLDPIDIGLGPERATNSVLLSRNLAHADLHLLPSVRLFGQLGGFYALGVPSSEAEPPDADDADVTQLFLESSTRSEASTSSAERDDRRWPSGPRGGVGDFIYAPPGSTLVSGAQSSERYTAAQTLPSLAYRADRHLSFDAEYSHVFAGPVITDAGGTDQDFFGTWTTFTY